MKDTFPILLVEDDEVDVMNVQRAFQKNQLINPLVVTGNGQEALDFLRGDGVYKGRNHPRPGIVLLDLNMPVMNGLEFLAAREKDPALKRIPVIVLTTSKEEKDRMDSFDYCIAGYIVKPVEFDKFVEAVRIIKLYWTLSELP